MEEKIGKDVFDEMAAKWPSAIVERGCVKQFTGGLVSGKTPANADSQGDGPLESSLFFFSSSFTPSLCTV